jgi:hypothetical protein
VTSVTNKPRSAMSANNWIAAVASCRSNVGYGSRPATQPLGRAPAFCAADRLAPPARVSQAARPPATSVNTFAGSRSPAARGTSWAQAVSAALRYSGKRGLLGAAAVQDAPHGLGQVNFVRLSVLGPRGRQPPGLVVHPVVAGEERLSRDIAERVHVCPGTLRISPAGTVRAACAPYGNRR